MFFALFFETWVKKRGFCSNVSILASKKEVNMYAIREPFTNRSLLLLVGTVFNEHHKDPPKWYDILIVNNLMYGDFVDPYIDIEKSFCLETSCSMRCF